MNTEEFKNSILEEADQIVKKNYVYLLSKTVTEIMNDSDSDMKYLVEGMIFEKTINLISGHSGVGKSLFTQLLAGCLSLGSDFLDKYLCKKSNVAFLDRENEDPVLKERYKKIDSDKDSIFYLDLETEFKGEAVNELEQFIQQNDIDVLIIDTMVRFQRGDENNSKDVASFFAILRKLLKSLKSIFLIHHLRKGNPDEKAGNMSARGSSDIPASVDSHFLIEQTKNADFLTIRNVKNRLVKEFSDVTFKIVSDEDELRFEFQGTAFDFKEHKLTKTKRLILEAIELHNEAGFDQIVEYVKDGGGYSCTNIRKIIKDYEEDNVIMTRKDVNKILYSVNLEHKEVQFHLKIKPQESIDLYS
ncbi:AAA family ATPase [Candidatus Dojkabacteria bacterium]|nr:AAA family ATPase [Candidatus Dojkabacteria bacterium]